MDEQRTTTSARRLPAAAALLVGAILAGGIAGGGIATAVVNTTSGTATSAASPAPATTVSVDSSSTESAVVDVVNGSLPAVVTIRSTVRGAFGQTGTGSGSGFIYDSRGLILTNHHVIDGATALTVILADGTEYDGTVVGSDASLDLAVVRIGATGLPTLALATGDARIGQSVIAIGTALGQYDLSVTTGVVSGVNRTLTASNGPARGHGEALSGALQHDAALNPGDSGGPLLDLAGNVIGVNTAVAGNAQGIAFAVPISHAADLIAEARSA
ncbi:MAG: trypsin-like peptidase domain-containing protein [Chloroflexota bacterium]